MLMAMVLLILMLCEYVGGVGDLLTLMLMLTMLIQAEMRRRVQQAEEEETEWWEGREKTGEIKMERDRQHYEDQIRRNEFLK